MEESKEIKTTVSRLCTASCKEHHEHKLYRAKSKVPDNLTEYLKNLHIFHSYGYFDRFYIYKYDVVMDQLENGSESSNSETTIDASTIYSEDEDEPVSKVNNNTCEWCDIDEETEEEIECMLAKCLKEDGTQSRYCKKHTDDDLVLLQMIEYYVRDILKEIDVAILKKFNSEIKGWKLYLLNQLNLSAYMVKKIILDKRKVDISTDEIIKYIYDLLDEQ
jgi:hypothetical protein